MSRKNALPERVKGTYAAMPHIVLDSVAYQHAAPMAKAILPELLRQLNGVNNGHLQLTMGYLARRGWKSCDVVQRAKAELLSRGLIVQTAQGGRNIGASQFAVTWLDISDWRGLDLQRGEYHPGKWAAMNKVPAPRGGADSTGSRNRAAPHDGAATSTSAPPDGTKTPVFADDAVPSDGSNVTMPLPVPCITLPPSTPRRVLLVTREAA